MRSIVLVGALVAVTSLPACASDCPKPVTAKDLIPDPAPKAEGTATEPTPEPKAPKLPVDFPERTLDAEIGQRVMAPWPLALETLKSTTASSARFGYHAGFVRSVGPTASVIRNRTGAWAPIPNALIIAIDADGRAKPGQIVLMHDETASDFDKAIVVDGGTEKAPMVIELSSWEDTPTAKTLPPGTFTALTAPLQAGTTAACAHDDDFVHVTVLATTDDAILAVSWGDHLNVFRKSSCAPIPITPTVAVGQKVLYRSGSDYDPATVKEVQAHRGVIVVEYTYSSSEKVYTSHVPYGQITDKLFK